MVDQKMLLNLLLLVLTSVAAVGGSVNVMENYEEEHPTDIPEEEREEFYQYVKKREQEKFQNMNNAPVNNVGLQMNGNVGAESFQAQVANVAPNANASNVAESFQAQVANASMNNVSPQANAPTLEGFTGGSFAAF